MASGTYLPPLPVLLRALRVSGERLDGPGKIAVEARVLRVLIAAAAAGQHFSAAFYRASYPDVAASDDAGLIPDLHQHFALSGYFEGRLGASPEVDPAFYEATYPDVAAGLAAGAISSAAEHFLRAGAAEGRAPNAAMRQQIEGWAALLREPSVFGPQGL